MSLIHFGKSRLRAGRLAEDPGPVWLYHGTDDRYLHQIVIDGLYPGPVAPDDADAFDEAFGAPTDPERGREASYWTTNPKFAEEFGKNILRMRWTPRAVQVYPSPTYDEWLVPHVIRTSALDVRIGSGGDEGDEGFMPLLDAVKQGLVLR